jgi:hypothetical protein
MFNINANNLEEYCIRVLSGKKMIRALPKIVTVINGPPSLATNRSIVLTQ